MAAVDVVPVGVAGLAGGVVQVVVLAAGEDTVVGGVVMAGAAATPGTTVTITATGPAGRTPTLP